MGSWREPTCAVFRLGHRLVQQPQRLSVPARMLPNAMTAHLGVTDRHRDPRPNNRASNSKYRGCCPMRQQRQNVAPMSLRCRNYSATRGSTNGFVITGLPGYRSTQAYRRPTSTTTPGVALTQDLDMTTGSSYHDECTRTSRWQPWPNSGDHVVMVENPLGRA